MSFHVAPQKPALMFRSGTGILCSKVDCVFLVVELCNERVGDGDERRNRSESLHELPFVTVFMMC